MKQEKKHNKSPFLRMIEEVRKALEQDLYHCALALALTLPDICGKVRFPNERSHPRYVNWFEEYAQPLFSATATVFPDNITKHFAVLTSEECYSLRCAVLHAGNQKFKSNTLSRIILHVNKGSELFDNYFVRAGDCASFDCKDLCEKICIAAENYYESVVDKALFDVDEVVIEMW